jgi:hypothetical protein
LERVTGFDEATLKKLIISDNPYQFPQSKVQFLDPYEVANLDPYRVRNLDALVSANPFREMKSQLMTIAQTFASSPEEQYGEFADFLNDVIEKADVAGEISPAEIEKIMDALYKLYDEKNEKDAITVEARGTFSGL